VVWGRWGRGNERRMFLGSNRGRRKDLEARGGIEPPIKVLQTLSSLIEHY
jgi:hypothetical protein